MCSIIRFLSIHGAGFVRNLVLSMAKHSPEKGERYLKQTLQLWRQALLRKGFSPEGIERDVKALEIGVRCRLWKVALLPGSSVCLS
jgi:hypothetical protein